jgi:hypothetical protein
MPTGGDRSAPSRFPALAHRSLSSTKRPQIGAIDIHISRSWGAALIGLLSEIRCNPEKMLQMRDLHRGSSPAADRKSLQRLLGRLKIL